MRITIVDAERCVGCQLCMFACVRRGGKGGLLDSSILIRSIGGLERGFRVIVCRVFVVRVPTRHAQRCAPRRLLNQNVTVALNYTQKNVSVVVIVLTVVF